MLNAPTEILTLDEKAFALKELGRADLAQQMAALGQFQQLLAPLEEQIASQRMILTTLAGRPPSKAISPSFKFASLRLPTKLPASFPSTLVLQRPDVRAADAAVHRARAEVGVALANRLPQFRIPGDAGSSAINLTQFFSGSGGFHSIVGAVSAPLFDAETLYHRQRASEDALLEAEAR